MSETRFVLVHPEMGIYLGNCLGLGFWSKLDPVGQPSACTFADENEMRTHVATWESPVEGWSARAVAGTKSDEATIAECVAAGLEPWSDE